MSTDAELRAREAATNIVETFEWTMDNFLPAKGETPEWCRRRRLIDEIAEGLLAFAASERSREGGWEAMRGAFEIADRAPELNMSNYDHNQVTELNQAMIEVHQTLKAAIDTEEEA